MLALLVALLLASFLLLLFLSASLDAHVAVTQISELCPNHYSNLVTVLFSQVIGVVFLGNKSTSWCMWLINTPCTALQFCN